MILNLLFVLPLMYYWNMGHVGLALATSVAAYLNAGLLLRGLRAPGSTASSPAGAIYSARLLAATAGMVLAIFWLVPDNASGWPGTGSGGLSRFCAGLWRWRGGLLAVSPAAGYPPAAFAGPRTRADRAECYFTFVAFAGHRLGALFRYTSAFGLTGAYPLMELIRGLHNLRPRHRGCVATMGAFDGVHLGHQAVIGHLLDKAGSCRCPR